MPRNTPPADLDISPFTALTADSRLCKPGMLFVAMDEAYAQDAEAKGAVVYHGENPRLSYAQLAARFYPGQPQHLVAVTGTDGKTSTAAFFRQLAELSGHRAASIGTLGMVGEGEVLLEAGTHTTPDAVALHQTLQKLHDAGYTHAALEASSHGLHQHRLDGAKIEAAAFTTFTRDHLDYHHTLDDYFAAKARLFTELNPKTAVLNADQPRIRGLRKDALGFGRAEGAELRIVSLKALPEGQAVELSLLGDRVAFLTPLVGEFQVFNMLAAGGLLLATGEKNIGSVLPKLGSVPGRMQRVAVVNGAAAYIDYAHTPDALAGALKALRPHTQGRLHVVFGCGGDRDQGKRAPMGEVAARYADNVIITDDNPRSEDPAVIRASVAMGAPGALNIGDRRKAVETALGNLQPGDVLLVAGKGHETTQTIAGVAHPFDDAKVIQELTA